MVLAEGKKKDLLRIVCCLKISPVFELTVWNTLSLAALSVASWLLRSLLLCLGFISTVGNSELQRRLVLFFFFLFFQRSQSVM